MAKSCQLIVVLFFALAAVAACSSPFADATGIVTQLKIMNECFDLDSERIEKSEDPSAKCLHVEWDFVFSYDAVRKPHAVLFIKPFSGIKIAYIDKMFSSVTLSDALTANYTTSTLDQDRVFETAIIQTPLNNYFKVHILQVRKSSVVTFEWERLT